MTTSNRSLETLLAQGGHFIDPGTGAIVPPIHPATTYARDERYELRGYGYSRSGNPTCALVERVLAELEGAEDALVFASGLAAIATFFDTVASNARVVAPRIMYHGAADWLRRRAERGDIELVFFETGAPDGLETAVGAGKTEVVWIEASVNPTWDVVDVRTAAEIAHGAGAILGVDATATPAVTLRALDLGADIVFHSGTKYLAGHSDLTAGALATRATDGRWEDVKLARTLMGGVLGAFEAWLLLRGMRTLHVRYERQSANAMAIARRFERHPRRRRRAVPGARVPSRACRRETSDDERLRRDALHPRRRWRRSRKTGRDPNPAVRAGDLARGGREPDRAPRDGGRSVQRGAGEPAPRLGGHRERGGTHRRPRAGARLRPHLRIIRAGRPRTTRPRTTARRGA